MYNIISVAAKHFVFQNNTTALIVAASKGKLYFVRELINHGADVNAEDVVSVVTKCS